MAEIVVHSVSELPSYSGPHEIPGIRFRPARQALGVSAWGMNVLDLAAGCEGYPVHDHRQDGQEEVYVVLSGRLMLHADGATYAMATGDLVRVPPEVSRKLVAEEDARVLALGGTPGQAYATDPRLATEG